MNKLILAFALSLSSLSAFTCDVLVGSYGECISNAGSMGNKSLIIEVSEKGITTNVDGESDLMPVGDSVYYDMPTNLKCVEDGAIITQIVEDGAKLVSKMSKNSEGSLVYENQYEEGSITFVCEKK